MDTAALRPVPSHVHQGLQPRPQVSQGPEVLAGGAATFVPHDVWPSSSPNLIPCDFYLWCVLLEMTNSSPHGSITSLKCAVTTACWNLPASDIKAACLAFCRQILAIQDAYEAVDNGGEGC